jgi:hypothetical protein
MEESLRMRVRILTIVVEAVLLLSLLIIASPGAAANCPVGSYLWTDSWGNRICKSFEHGGTSTIEGTLERCPVGTHPWVDSWGNRVCKSFDDGRQFYDTSRGCPTGTYLWRDSWGNPVCKSF